MTPDREAATPFVVPETPSEARQGATRADIPSLVTEEMVAEAIRALSPLPPGSRVVVIPAEEDARASLEFDLQVKVSLAMKPHIPTVPLRLRHALAEAAVSAALRALTEGDTR